MADQRNTTFREYRKGNWTVHETMILITAKKMDEERRMKRNNGGESSEGRSRPAELRWKWVEDYCWSNGCLRSQNQCNDKWDNLMRDYKKVREYESRLLAQNENGEGNNTGSYWKLERHERKDKNLPTSLLLQIYEALVEVVERKGIGTGTTVVSYVLQHQPAVPTVQLSLPPPPLLHHYPSSDPTPTPSPPLPLQLPPPPPFSQSLPTLDSDTSEYPEDSSPAKRRRKGEASNSNEEDGSSSAISRSASIIADALQSCEQQEERRHREFLNLQERKLKLEESRNQSDKETMNGLVMQLMDLLLQYFHWFLKRTLGLHKDHNRTTIGWN